MENISHCQPIQTLRYCCACRRSIGRCSSWFFVITRRSKIYLTIRLNDSYGRSRLWLKYVYIVFFVVISYHDGINCGQAAQVPQSSLQPAIIENKINCPSLPRIATYMMCLISHLNLPTISLFSHAGFENLQIYTLQVATMQQNRCKRFRLTFILSTHTALGLDMSRKSFVWGRSLAYVPFGRVAFFTLILSPSFKTIFSIIWKNKRT